MRKHDFILICVIYFYIKNCDNFMSQKVIFVQSFQLQCTTVNGVLQRPNSE